jgi:putative tricarboxylic transport membrane protein
MMENALRQSLIMSDGSAVIFLTRPISMVIMLLGLALLILPLIPWVKQKREVVGGMAASDSKDAF